MSESDEFVNPLSVFALARRVSDADGTQAAVPENVPSTVASSMTTFPASVTLNGAVARLANVSPAQNAMSELAFPLFIPARFDPVPTEMLAVFAAPEVRIKLVAESVVEAIVKAAIDPLVQVSAPA